MLSKGKDGQPLKALRTYPVLMVTLGGLEPTILRLKALCPCLLDDSAINGACDWI